MVAHLCPVCVEDYDPGFHAPLCAPCGHSICRGCAVKLEGGRCPQCRTDLPAASDMPVVRSLIPGLTESTAGQVGCDATEMQVFVRTMDGRTHNVCVLPSNTVDELKAKVAKLTERVPTDGHHHVVTLCHDG
ncbi:hypothetical protein HYH03_015509 [Edaphochlamys debaryana]|uniref:RING-type domain-containing protein n=1 Tax=Edaphochlamys debaryana TaxID=47281 RepID=A0A835XN30_9CHLO|nr:hypothetical protein HYH03_015509 [Edaphochlamys debaryana]|eukprot:KAG2485798.1 hypothetical protein HYH03_015509 [Edaphochlamys debaryana]